MIIIDGVVVSEVNDAQVATEVSKIVGYMGATDEQLARLRALTDDGTLLSAIMKLDSALNGITFSINPANNCLRATYDDGLPA